MLTVDQARERAQDIVARAKAAGADAADAVFADDTSLDVSVRLGALEDVGRSENAELGLRVFVGRRSASVSTSDLTGAAIDILAERAVAMAREAPEDAWAGLAPEDRLLHGAPPQLDLDDGGQATPESLKEAALAAEDAARAIPGVSNSDGAGASASRSVWALATSHGFAAAYAASGYGLSASVLAGAGGSMVRDYAHHSARHRSHLEAAGIIGRRAGERTVARVDPGRVASGAMPVVFDPRVGSSLIGHLIGAISGQAISRKTSFLLDSLGTQVFASGITICDDPHRPHGLRSRPFDGEGLPVSPVEIVSHGMLETWLLDSASARQLGLEPTGHASRGGAGSPGVSTSNVHIEAGQVPPATLIADITRGVFVTELIGMGVNGVTGDYSRGAAGFLIEDGEITTPVAEFTIAGNLKDMFLAMTAANDLEFRYGTNAPTLRVEGMTVAVVEGLSDSIAAIAAEAGALALAKWRTDFRQWEKSPGNPVCEVDLDVNDLIRQRLSALLPEAGWLSEETVDNADRLAQSLLWVVDPIDGTRDFVRGRPGWAVSIALVQDGQPLIGVLDAPARGEVWRAEAGKGATRNGLPVHAGDRTVFAGARVPTDVLPKVDHDLVAIAKPNSIALRIAMVAAGEADLVATLRWGYEWDIAAAVLIASEAGAAVSDAFGKPLFFNTPSAQAFGVLATAPGIHAAAVERLADRAKAATA